MSKQSNAHEDLRMGWLDLALLAGMVVGLALLTACGQTSTEILGAITSTISPSALLSTTELPLPTTTLTPTATPEPTSTDTPSPTATETATPTATPEAPFTVGSRTFTPVEFYGQPPAIEVAKANGVDQEGREYAYVQENGLLYIVDQYNGDHPLVWSADTNSWQKVEDVWTRFGHLLESDDGNKKEYELFRNDLPGAAMGELYIRTTGNTKYVPIEIKGEPKEFIAVQGIFRYDADEKIAFLCWIPIIPNDGMRYWVNYQVGDSNTARPFTVPELLDLGKLDEPGTKIRFFYARNPASLSAGSKASFCMGEPLRPEANIGDTSQVRRALLQFAINQKQDKIYEHLWRGTITQVMLDNNMLAAPGFTFFSITNKLGK